MRALDFAINHIAAPRHSVAALAALGSALGVSALELRNDLPGMPMQDGTSAVSVRADAVGMNILSINALQRFEDWNEQRAAEAADLSAYAQASGARALVLCPTNTFADSRDAAARAAGLRAALRGLAPILSSRGLLGFIEPLGFVECALRLKRQAVDAIDDTGTAPVFQVLHDTFHHFLAGEAEIFPERSGLVHISGVEDTTLKLTDIRDAHRVLVGPADIMNNRGQIAALQDGGYAGVFSFEPFSAKVHAIADIESALRDSMDYLRAG